LNILREEGFARVHRKRKGDALRCSDRPREKPSKILSEHKECTQETISPSYKLRRKREKFLGGKEKVHRGTMNFEGFQAEQSCGRVCTELCKECRRSSIIA
jgi:hypothetical protein